MSDRLFFAYTKPADPHDYKVVWEGNPLEVEECPACGGLIAVGSWPFCPHGTSKHEQD